MSDLTDPIYLSIVKARITLLFQHPFFGNLASRLEVIDASKWCETAATDGRRLYYNREFIKSLTKSELIFVIGHEILHCVYDHFGRRGNKRADIWNMANDYIVNSSLVTEQIGTMPSIGLISSKYTDEMTSEEVYKDLLKNSVEIKMPLDMHLDMGGGKGGSSGDGDCPACGGTGIEGNPAGGKSNKSNKSKKSGKGSGKGDKTHDHSKGGENSKTPKPCPNCSGSGKANATVTIINGDGTDGPVKITEEELENIRNEVRSAVIQAAQSSGAGSVPAGIKRIIKELTESKIDWREILEMHIKSSVKDDFTYQKVSRKSWACNAILPGMNVMDSIDVALCIDTSGSMTDKMVADFLGEVKGIMETFPDFIVRLWTFDTKVYGYKEFTPYNLDDITTYKPKGGGGTDFECNWKFMKDPLSQGFDMDVIEPNRFVMFTDGYPCGGWGDEEYCETLFVIHSDKSIEAPFGVTAYYEEEIE